MENFNVLKCVKDLDAGNLDSLINYCDLILKGDSKNGKAYLFKARAYKDLGEYSKANFILSVGLDQCMNPNDRLDLLTEQIETYGCMQNYKSALEVCIHALTIVPEEIDLLFTQAILYYHNAKFNKALENLKKIKIFDTNELYKEEINELNDKILEWL